MEESSTGLFWAARVGKEGRDWFELVKWGRFAESQKELSPVSALPL